MGTNGRGSAGSRNHYFDIGFWLTVCFSIKILTPAEQGKEK